MTELPDIRNPDALETIRRAASSVGLTEEQLVTLALDSGVSMLPTQNKLTEEITVETLGKRMWDAALAVEKSKRPEWFKGLSPAQKEALVTVLRSKGFASEGIAQNFGTSSRWVTSVYNKHADDLGRPLVNIRLATLAGQLQIMAERAQEMAMRKNDPSTFFRIQKDFLSMLQSMGIVEKAATKIEVDQHVSIGIEERDAHLDRLIELRQKQKIRLEEIKKAEVELIDTQPLEEDELDDL